MIQVTRLNGIEIYLNAELIETVEATPDTLITLTTGKKVMVSEELDQIADKVIEYRRRVNCISALEE